MQLWDPRVREPVQTLANRFQMLCVATNADASRIYASGIDNDIKVSSSPPRPALSLR